MSRFVRALPSLRFSEFQGDWDIKRIDYFVQRFTNPVAVEPTTIYREIGVRSHGRGVFHKPEIFGETLGNKRVFWVHPDAFIVNIVFAWEQAVARTSDDENGFIASHRFPMYLPKDGKIDLQFMLLFFLRPRGKHLLGLASPGGAGRNKTLGQAEFAKLKITAPKIAEQRKIAAFLGAVDAKLDALRRKRALLADYKRGVMQQIFTQAVRFVSADGSPFPDWEEMKAKDIMTESRIKGSTGDLAHKITVKLWGRGVYKKQETGRGSKNTQYYIRHAGQFIYSKLDFLNCAFGIIPTHLDGLESTVDLPCFDITSGVNRLFILEYIKQRSFYIRYGSKADGSRKAKRIHADTFLDFPIRLPHIKEQEKIATYLTAIDKKITAVDQQIEQVATFKKGLLQQMFV